MNVQRLYRCGGVLLTTFLLAACQGKYHVVGAEGEQLSVDAHWDAQAPERVGAALAPFKHQVDSTMNRVVGE